MDSTTHEYRSEVYAVRDGELSPPFTDSWQHPWEFVSMTTLRGYPEGIFHDGRRPRIVVVWARRKGSPSDRDGTTP